MLMDSPDDYIGPMNTGNPGKFTILELAEKVIRMIGSKSTIIFKPLLFDDLRQRKPDISLARAKFGWGLKIFLEEGLERTYSGREYEIRGRVFHVVLHNDPKLLY